MDWEEEKESPQREEEGSKLSPEELRREMYRVLVSNNIITEEDLKARVEEEPPKLETFVKATSYLLENHRRLFRLFDRNGAYYEAVKLARRLAEENIVIKQESEDHPPYYYFNKDDIKSREAIDDAINKLYPDGVREPEKKKRISADSRFMPVSSYIREKHRFLFNGSDMDELDKAYRVSNLLVREGIIPSRMKNSLIHICIFP